MVPITIQALKKCINADIFCKNQMHFFFDQECSIKSNTPTLGICRKKILYPYKRILNKRSISEEVKKKIGWAVKKSYYDTPGNTLKNRCLSNKTAAIY